MAAPLLPATMGQVGQVRRIVDTPTRAAQQTWGSHRPPFVSTCISLLYDDNATVYSSSRQWLVTTARDMGAVIVGNAFVIFCIAMAKRHDLDQDDCRGDRNVVLC
jgi:hypothetical protein